MAGWRWRRIRAGRRDDRNYRSDVEWEFEVDEYDRVWMYRDGDCQIVGRKNYVRTEMRRS
ncbi:MAG TPA: hypothetical protein VFQ67_10230 [Allosphingosinicella sp.]|jgi:hypothetical protein|nr:hypothetical protein [Allosphingosinicella sp.]